MEPDRRNRVSELHDAALARPPAERSAFLRAACDGDEMLRQEVESLLVFESASERFLEAPAAALVASTSVGMPMLNRQLGLYTIVARLGAGGMGEVYRARDSKLRRDVAIKILPPRLMADPERRARFAREARLLATLNHPHIGAIYGLEESEGLTALVLELIEGPTLADRLARGALPIADALIIARQIAEALEAAHQKGIIHRDLKPANIVLVGGDASSVSASDLRAKVLDFGLAKTIAVGLEGDLTTRPESLDGTEEGRVLGTPAYMSPEQARGQAVDKRTDIWAFGCVIFEMLTGTRAFGGETISDTFVSILERDPDWTLLPARTPASVRTALERCLRKDPRKRLHDITDVLIELEDDVTPGATAGPAHAPADTSVRRQLWLGWIVATVLALVLVGTIGSYHRESAARPELVEFPLVPAKGTSFRGAPPEFAISPDGRHVAFVATSATGSSLWIRPLASVQPRELPGTQGARNPFWSPDSQSIGFLSGTSLMTVSVNGGPASVLCQRPGKTYRLIVRGTWTVRDAILLGSDDGAIYQVDAKKGGTPTRVTSPRASEFHFGPLALPDGEHFVYQVNDSEIFGLRFGSLTGQSTVVPGTFDGNIVYVEGYLLFVRSGRLMAQSFDSTSGSLLGSPSSLGKEFEAANLPPALSVSSNGRLVLLTTATRNRQLTWLDRHGNEIRAVGEPGMYGNFDLSPDGKRVAADRLIRRPGAESLIDIWLIDLATGAATPLTDDPASDFDPAWSPDGKYIIFNSNRPVKVRSGLFVRPANGSGVDTLVVASDSYGLTVADWSPTTHDLIFNGFNDTDAGDLLTMSLSGDRTPKVFVRSKHAELHGAFSPDGRWVAYQSNASGRYEVIVRSFPDGEMAHTISRDGGMCPRWRQDGKELFFLGQDGTMMAAGIDPTDGSSMGVQSLFPTALITGNSRPYAVTPDGERFLLPITPDAQLNVVMDWRALLPR